MDLASCGKKRQHTKVGVQEEASLQLALMHLWDMLRIMGALLGSSS